MTLPRSHKGLWTFIVTYDHNAPFRLAMTCIHSYERFVNTAPGLLGWNTIFCISHIDPFMWWLYLRGDSIGCSLSTRCCCVHFLWRNAFNLIISIAEDVGTSLYHGSGTKPPNNNINHRPRSKLLNAYKHHWRKEMLLTFTPPPPLTTRLSSTQHYRL